MFWQFQVQILAIIIWGRLRSGQEMTQPPQFGPKVLIG